jgi:two-component system phosphate regulon sensor histidine kinase PhoR
MTYEAPQTDDLKPRPRPWSVPAVGVACAAGLFVAGFLQPDQAAEIFYAAWAALAVTAAMGVQAFYVVRQRAREAALSAPVPLRIAEPDAPPFEAALEQTPEPTLIIGGGRADDLVARRILFANAAARDLLRLQRQGALLATALRDPEVLEAIDEALFSGLSRSVPYVTRTAHERSWSARTRPLPPREGEALALLSFRDETERRRLETMRVDFLANASHELRTPLAALAGFIETLRGHAKDDPVAQDRFLTIMAAQAERMRRLVHDLLSLSRIELNEHVPPSDRVDLASVVADVAGATAPIAAERAVTIETRLPPGEAALALGERDQIVQVVQNLLDNAVKYTPDGGVVVVEVQGEVSPEEGRVMAGSSSVRLPLLTPDRADLARYACVRVRDQGPGIHREHLPRLSERFYRVEGQKSGERSGTGLGLAIVKHVMNRHRGGLAVESAPGEGTLFTAYFPLHADAQAGEAPSGTGRARGRYKTVAEAS